MKWLTNRWKSHVTVSAYEIQNMSVPQQYDHVGDASQKEGKHGLVNTKIQNKVLNLFKYIIRTVTTPSQANLKKTILNWIN